MRQANPLAVALMLTLAAAIGSMRLWWLHATRMEQRYLLDYCRFTLGMPSWHWWPYRIETVQHLPISVLPDTVYGGRPLYLVLLWPLVATAVVGIAGFVIAAMLSSGDRSQQGKVIRGPKIISNFEWWLSQIGRKKGFYIEQ